jgi:serine/threonine-protein kinase
VTVPNVVGQSAREAGAELAEVGLAATVVRVPAEESVGTVVAQSPRGGTTVQRGSRVRLNVSSGRADGTGTGGLPPPPITPPPPPAAAQVPSVVGRNQLEAQRALRAAGFVPRTTFVTSTRARGTVIRQRPAAGTSAPQGSEVRLDVSSGPTPGAATEVPDVIGVDEGTAVSELEAAGFDVQVLDEPTDDPNADGIVIDQDPEAGSRAPAGAQVVITVGRLTG